jgi:hypothetical protein
VLLLLFEEDTVGKFIDITGQTFGRLTVIDYAGLNIRGEATWECRCSCGNPNSVIVPSYDLRKRHTSSCGCLQREVTSKLHKQTNRYEIRDDYVVGYTNRGNPFFVDKEDLNKIQDYCWVEKRQSDTIYPMAYVSKGKYIRLGRLIMDAQDTEVVDHINHDTMDNRRVNLRIVKQAENMLNVGIRSNNTTGVTGVWREKRRSKWVAEIKRDGIKHFLGQYDSFDEAVAARKAAEEKYFGEYSYDNSIAAVPRIAM